MSTRFVSASWTIAARSSGCIAKRHSELAQLVAQRRRAAPGSRGGSRRAARPARPRAPRRRARAEPAPPDAMTGIDTARATARGELEVVAVARAVGVDRREQDLARRRAPRPRGPVDGVAAVSARCRRASTHLAARGVDRDDDGLRAERARRARRSARAARAPRSSPRPCRRPPRAARPRRATERTPPPTVNGIASRSATRATRSTSAAVPRASP